MRTLLGCIAAALLLAGCSAIRTAYDQAGHLALWRTDDYFDLDGEQKRAFRARFARLHAWHRATQLDRYAELLEALETRIRRGPQPQDIAWALDGVRAQARPLVLQGYRDAAALLATLSDEQVAQARRRLERENRKFAREHGVGAPADEQQRLRAKRDIETVEHWSGPLDRDQRARIGALSAAQPLDAVLRHQERLRRQREFFALLDQRRDPAFPASLREWLLDWNAGRSDETHARMNRYREARGRFLVAAYESLRTDQQRKVGERLQDYVRALRELARAPNRHADAGAMPAPAR